MSSARLSLIVLFGWLLSLPSLCAQDAAVDGEVRVQGGALRSGTITIEPVGTRVTVGADGRFTLPPLPSGSYTLVVGAEGCRTDRMAFVLGPGEHRTLAIVLETLPAKRPVWSSGAYARGVQFDLLPSELTRRFDAVRFPSATAEASVGETYVVTTMRAVPSQGSLTVRAMGGFVSPILSSGYSTFSPVAMVDDPIVRHSDGYEAVIGDFPVDQLRLEDAGFRPNWGVEVSAGDRLLENHLGVSLGINAQRSYQEMEAERAPYGINADNEAYVANRQRRVVDLDRTRLGLDGRLEYRFDENHQVNALVAGALREIHELRILDDTVVIGQGFINNGTRVTMQQQRLLAATLVGIHRLGSLDLRWSGGAANYQQPRPDRTDLRLYRTFDTSTAGNVVTGPVTLSAIIHDWLENDNDELYGSVDGTLKGTVTVQAGGSIRDKRRSNFENAYRLVQRDDTAHAGVIPPFISLDALDLEVRNPGGTPLFGTNNYTCRESVLSGYLTGLYTLDSLTLTLGLRAEHTDGHYEAFDPNSVSVIVADKVYTDFLPSVLARYALPAGSSLRLSVARTLVRPNYYDLVPYSTIAGDQQIAGNPYLEPAHSLNFDARYDASVFGLQALSVGAFYRVINGPIERTIDIRNPSLPTLSAKNFGTGQLGGAEIAVAVEPVSGLTLEGSYTWAHSSITSSKVVFDRVAGTTLLVDETRELQGQPEHAATFTATYRDTDSRWFFQLGMNYVGRRLYQVSLYREHNDYLEPTVVLDLMAEKQFTVSESGGGLTGFIRANNLLDALWQVREQSGVLLESEHYGLGVAAGIAWSF